MGVEGRILLKLHLYEVDVILEELVVSEFIEDLVEYEILSWTHLDELVQILVDLVLELLVVVLGQQLDVSGHDLRHEGFDGQPGTADSLQDLQDLNFVVHAVLVVGHSDQRPDQFLLVRHQLLHVREVQQDLVELQGTHANLRQPEDQTVDQNFDVRVGPVFHIEGVDL